MKEAGFKGTTVAKETYDKLEEIRRQEALRSVAATITYLVEEHERRRTEKVAPRAR